MPTGADIRVHGLKELNRALAKADKDVKKGIRVEYRRVAEPVRAAAEGMAVQNISNIGDKWAKMRVGFTAETVYVAPGRRGLKGDSSLKRPNLAGRLMDEALQPALDQNTGEILVLFENMLDQISNEF